MYEPTQHGECPNCGCVTDADGVHNGIGYVYPPLHCSNCGWSETCGLWGSDNCDSKCTEYQYCCANDTINMEDK